MFWLRLSLYHPGLLWVNYNRPGWYPVINPSNYRINRVPMGGRGLLDFRPTTFGGVR